MPWEHFLEPDAATFPPEAVAAMHDQIRALPHHVWPDGAYTIYASPEERDSSVALHEAIAEADYAHAIVHISPERVLVAIVGDPVTDVALRELVESVQARWPSSLYYGDLQVAPESLTARHSP
jgi:hypothetical protein